MSNACETHYPAHGLRPRMNAGVDWFIPAHVHSGDLDVLRRARLVVMFVVTLILLAVIYIVIFLSMNCLINAAALGLAVGMGLTCLYIMRRTGSSFVAGNLLTVTFYGVLTVLACRLGGQGALTLPWYAAVPVVTLSTAGRRSAFFWLVVTVLSLTAFYALDYSGYSFPNDPTPRHYELLCLMGWIGLIMLVFALALLYEAAKVQMLHQVRKSEERLKTLLSANPTGILVIDAETHEIIEANSAALEMIGAPSEDVLGHVYHEYICPAQAGHCPITDSEQRVDRAERVLLRAGGAKMPILKTVVSITLNDRPCLLESFVDITERKRAEKTREFRLDCQQKLNDLQQALLGPGVLDEKLKRITDGVVDIFNADFCRIWITHQGDRCESGCMHAGVMEGPHVCRYRDRCLWLMSSSGRYTHIDGEVHRRVPFGCYKIGQVASGKESKFLTNEAATDPRVHNNDWVKELGLVSFAGYQLRPPGGETIGVLALFAKHTISPDEDALLESLGSTIAQIVQKAKADEEVKQWNRFLNSVLESLTHPFLVIDAVDYSIVMANTAAQHESSSLPKTCHVLSHHRDTPCDGDGHECLLVEIKRTGKPAMMEHIHYDNDGNPRTVEVHAYPIFDEGGRVAQGIEYSLDITERKQAEAMVEEVQRQLLDASHQAGMAEVATDVLHNVGNVLNSVNVSAGLVNDKIRASRVPGLAKATALMSEHPDDLGTFITQDERGKQLPGYLTKLAEHLANEHADVLGELRHLTENIEHIKNIVSMQQSLSGVSGVTESVLISDLLDDLLKMDASSLAHRGIKVTREYDELPMLTIDKHKLTQILMNLLKNAKEALIEDQGPDPRLSVRLRALDQNRVQIEVADNAVGIPPENLLKIFAHGFTTKEHGHGFGLHGSALAAAEMGGSLTAYSDGPGRGATFTLELPRQVTEKRDVCSAK